MSHRKKCTYVMHTQWSQISLHIQAGSFFDRQASKVSLGHSKEFDQTAESTRVVQKVLSLIGFLSFIPGIF